MKKAALPLKPPSAPFDVQAFLESSGVARKVITYRRGEFVFKQGDASHVAPNEVHRGFADATLGTRLVAVRFKPKDKPLVTLIQR